MGLPAIQSQSALNLTALDMNSEIRIDAGEPVVLSVAAVLAWVAPGAPPQDALKFLLACRSARLNPLLGEAHLIPMGQGDKQKWSTVVTKGGYLKRAHQNPDYDGHTTGLVIQNGNHIVDVDGSIRPQGWTVLGGWAKVWRKGVERPVYKRLGFDEYRKQTYIWNSMPLTMIEKCALVAALREAFGISDSYDESEADIDVTPNPSAAAGMLGASVARDPLAAPHAPVAIEAEVIEAESVGPPQTSYRTNDTIGYACPEKVAEIVALLDRVDATHDERQAMLVGRNVSRLDDLTVKQAEEILVTLRSWDSAAQADAVFGESEPPATAEGIVIPEVDRKEG